MIDRVPRSYDGKMLRIAGKYRDQSFHTRRSPSFTALRFEELESRTLLTATSLDGAPYIYLGPSDNIALDQPRVAIELFEDAAGSSSVGPSSFNTVLLDTGANSVLAFGQAVADMNENEPGLAISGVFEEEGVAGTDVFDISDSYRFDFAGTSGERNTLQDTRILASDDDVSMFGPWGIVGMPAMAGRVTSLDMSVWTGTEFAYMGVDFSDSVPSYDGDRFSVAVDNRLTWDPEENVTSGDFPPVWADIPFLTGTVLQDGTAQEGTFLLDTGAQLSVMPVNMAMDVGLDSNGDGILDENDDNFARYETVGGIGGQTTAPVFLFDEFHVPTTQGPDLVWTDLQWLVLDIAGGQFGVFGCEALTSGWIEPYFGLSTEPGYFEQVHFDFRNFQLHPSGGGSSTQTGLIHFDVNPNVSQVTDSSVPGATIIETDSYTMVTESGMEDIYQIVLTQPPSADVTIDLSNSAGELTAVDLEHPTNSFLVFSPDNWNSPQTVRVTAVNDGAAEGFHRSSVLHTTSSSDPNYQDVDIRRVLVNIVDQSGAGVMLLPNNDTTDVAEGGNTDTYQVALTSQPTGNVTVELRNSYGQVTAVDALNPGNDFLVFTPDNWSTPQEVLVTAVDDAITEGPHHTRIMHRLSTSDFNYQQTYVFPKPVNITDNDANPQYDDIVGRDTSTGIWWVGKSTGSSFASEAWAKWSPNLNWVDVQVGDFNGDGLDDLIGRVESTGEWWVAESTSSGSLSTKWSKWSPYLNWVDVRVGDFNNDGSDDIAGRVESTGEWWVGTSTGSAFASAKWAKWSPYLTWENVLVGDFDNDGNDDIAGRVQSTGEWWVGASTGSAFASTKWAKWSPYLTWVDVQAGDFNGDGRADVAGRVQSTGEWWVGASTGSAFASTKWAKWSPSLTWVDVQVGDFNNDGSDDIIGRVQSTGEWWVGASTDTYFASTKWSKWSPYLNWLDVRVGDFTGDGRADIAGRIQSTGEWWVGASTGSAFASTKWAKWSPYVTWDNVMVGDFDGATAGSGAVAAAAAADQFWSDLGNEDEDSDSLLVENQVVNLLKMEE